MTTPHRLPDGYRLEEFRFESCIGGGGFGLVYAATDTALRRPVVIKEYLPNTLAVRDTDRLTVRAKTGDDAETYAWGLRRFLAEARLLAGLDHPYVVHVYRVLTANNTAYLAMKDEGRRTLRNELDEAPGRRLSEARARALLEPLLSALETVHGQGILHRDLKPGNILIRSDGSPVLIDFGAARQPTGQRSQSLHALITPPYAPLEQYDPGIAQGPYTDLYSLGALLYEALSGAKPPEAAGRVLNDTLVPLAKRPGGRCAPDLAAAVDAALAVRPERRPATVAAFRALLTAEEPTVLRPAPGSSTAPAGLAAGAAGRAAGAAGRRRAAGRLAAAALLAAILGAGGWLVFQDDPARDASASGSGVPTPDRTPAPDQTPGQAPDQTPDPAPDQTPGQAPDQTPDPAPDQTPDQVPDQAPARTPAPDLAALPGGCFQMGSPPGEVGRDGDENQHRVCVEAFEIGRHEVTQAEWRALMGTNPARFSGCDRCPVEQVSWNDARDYLDRLNARTGGNYRLPTEAEWEYAARAGTTTAYWWGDTASQAFANSSGTHDRDRWEYTSPVGSFPANPWGLHDMLGNVWEWTCSDYDAHYGGAERRCGTEGTHRVFRGGAWSRPPASVRAALRNGSTPDERYDSLGFRLARTPRP